MIFIFRCLILFYIGARLLTGGKRIPGKGFFFEPTVLSNVNNQMSVMQDESFGPIIGIVVLPRNL